MSYNDRNLYGDPLPEVHPKLLDTFVHFRVMIREDLRAEYGTEIPIIPLTRDLKNKSLKQYANDKYAIKNGDLISYKRFDSRGYSQYIFITEDGVEVVVPEGFIKSKFLFPINK